MEKRQQKELQDYFEKLAKERIKSSNTIVKRRVILKEKHFIEYYTIWIQAATESCREYKIDSEKESNLSFLLISHFENKIEQEISGIEAAMLSYGHSMGSAIIENAKSSTLEKLSAVKSHCLDKLRMEIEYHNYKLEKEYMDSKNHNFPILEEEQNNILCRLVEAHRNVLPNKRREFIVTRDGTSDSVVHDGFNKGWTEIPSVNLRMLDSSNLIKIYETKNPHIEFSFTITSFGFQYYEYIKTNRSSPVERVQNEILSYINVPSFEQKYPLAYTKWKEAEKLLWVIEPEINLSTVGHLCREALQEFLDVLIKKHGLEEKYYAKDKTKGRVKALIEKKNSSSSETVIKLLEKFYDFWDQVSDLVQRQEHYGLKEGEKLMLNDAKRVVIYTVIVMNELDGQFS